MPSSEYRKLFLPVLLVFLLPALFLGCRIEVSNAQTDEEVAGQIAEETETESQQVTEIRIGSGRIVVDGDTLSAAEFDIRLDDFEELDEVEKELEGIGVSIKRGDVVRFGEKIKVKEGEKVRGSVVSFGGDVVVRGMITEDAISIGGDIFISSTGDVHGSAVSIGGTVHREPGGRIGEDEVSLGPGWIPLIGILGPHSDFHGVYRPPFLFTGLGGFIVKMFLLGLMIAVGMGVVLLFPKQLDIIEERIRTAPGKSGLAGFLGEILIFPLLIFAIILLCITVVGIPLIIFVVPLYIFAIIAAFFFGYIGMASITAKIVEGRANLNMGSPYARVALGIIILSLAWMMASFFGFVGGPIRFLAVLFNMLAWMIFYLASTIGFGAVVMTRFGSRMNGLKLAAPKPEDKGPEEPGAGTVSKSTDSAPTEPPTP
jgi:hypothetical protein